MNYIRTGKAWDIAKAYVVIDPPAGEYLSWGHGKGYHWTRNRDKATAFVAGDIRWAITLGRRRAGSLIAQEEY